VGGVGVLFVVGVVGGGRVGGGGGGGGGGGCGRPALLLGRHRC